MRILIVSQHFWPESFRINSFVDELIKTGADIEVLTGQPNYPAGRPFEGYRWWASGTDSQRGYSIHRVPLLPRGRGNALRLLGNYASFILSGLVFGPWRLRGRRFDVIFVYATSPVLQAILAIWLKRLKQAKLVIWVQDLWPDVLAATGFIKNPLVLRAVGLLVGLVYRRADLLLVQSPQFAPAVRNQAGRVPVEYFPNPGEAHTTSESDVASHDACEPQSPFVIMFAGNLGRAQALETVIEAASLLNPADQIQIVLVGSGSQREELHREVARRELKNVTLPGQYPSEEMPRVYQGASALLLTLVDDPLVRLTIPSKVQSYLAAGLPIIAALDGPGASIVTEAGAGLVCRAEDARALADTMVAMRCKSEEERRQMGLAGQLYYREHFDPLRLAAKLNGRLVKLVMSDSAVGALDGR